MNSKELKIAVANADATAQTGFDENVDRFDQLIASLNVTAVTGTNPTMDLTIQWSLDGVNWVTVMTFTQATAATQEYETLTTPFGSRLRASYIIGGDTPDFTFDITILAKG